MALPRIPEKARLFQLVRVDAWEPGENGKRRAIGEHCATQEPDGSERSEWPTETLSIPWILENFGEGEFQIRWKGPTAANPQRFQSYGNAKVTVGQAPATISRQQPPPPPPAPAPADGGLGLFGPTLQLLAFFEARADKTIDAQRQFTERMVELAVGRPREVPQTDPAILALLTRLGERIDELAADLYDDGDDPAPAQPAQPAPIVYPGIPVSPEPLRPPQPQQRQPRNSKEAMDQMVMSLIQQGPEMITQVLAMLSKAQEQQQQQQQPTPPPRAWTPPAPPAPPPPPPSPAPDGAE